MKKIIKYIYPFLRFCYVSTIKFIEFFFLIKSAKKIVDVDKKRLTASSIDIYSIAFNNVEIIEYQIYHIQKYIKDPHYKYIVIDNSTDKAIRGELEKICRQNKVGYISLKKNPMGIFGSSYSHAAAMNWMWKHFTQKRQPTYFAFFDHDFFPIQPVSIKETMNSQPIYGRRMKCKKYWYLWAGFCIFEYAFLRNKKVDFKPCKRHKEQMDTGGSNYYSIYASLDYNRLKFSHSERIKIRNTKSTNDDFVEFFEGKWFHLMNASLWTKGTPKDFFLIDKLLEEHIKYDKDNT